jgi:hypothetical protein
MSFLENFIGQHRQTKSNVMVQDNSADENEFEVKEEEIHESTEDNAVSPITPPNDTSACPPPVSQAQGMQSKTQVARKKRKMTASEMIAGPMFTFLKSRSEPQPAEPVGSNRKFFESLLPDVEKLSTRRQRDFKLKVLSLLNGYMDEQENENLIITISTSSSAASPASTHSSYNPQGQTNLQGFQPSDPWEHCAN